MFLSSRNAGWPVLSLWAVLTACGEDLAGPRTQESLAPALAVQALSFRQLAAGWYHTCGVTTDGLAWCWGLNRDGAVGDGTTINRPIPTRVRTSLRFRQISAGAFNTCGITTDDRVVCWGFGGDGQLGTGSTVRRLTPVAVAGDRRYRDVRAGYRHACGVTTANVAFCWGDNTTGQLGDGTMVRRLNPARVAGGFPFARVVAGSDHSCGLTTDGRSYCWGQNQYGQLGFPTIAAVVSRPLRVDASIGGLRQVSAGDQHSCAVTTSRLAYCWGRAHHGESGSGFAGVFYSPLAVSGGIQFVDLGIGGGHACGVSTESVTYCWGFNGSGQLGSVTGGTDRLKPTPVAGGHRFKWVHAGMSHSCAIDTENRAWCWGTNGQGQLGIGYSGGVSAVPVAVGGS